MLSRVGTQKLEQAKIVRANTSNIVQSIYVIYSVFQPSSCLSDREEDEIYGFGYGVFGPRAGRANPQPSTSTSQFQMPQQQQQSLPNNPTNVPVTQQQKYVLSIFTSYPRCSFQFNYI